MLVVMKKTCTNEYRRGRPSLTPTGGLTKPTFVALAPPEREVLKSLAEANGRSVSGQIRHIVRKWLAKAEGRG